MAWFKWFNEPVARFNAATQRFKWFNEPVARFKWFNAATQRFKRFNEPAARFNAASQRFKWFNEPAAWFKWIKKMGKVENFEDLVIYQKARALAVHVYEITREGEFKYDTRFVQQIRAAVGSISDNIAEGFERQGNKEFKNFLYIAKGSCGEVRSQIQRALDVGFISKETYIQLYDEAKALSVAIANFIKSIKDSDYKGSKYS